MLKLRRKEIEVSSIMMWTVLLRDRQANTPWQKLKRNLLLFLQLLILASLVLSLVRPALLTSSIASGSVVVILDGSASMGALDEQVAGSPVTRFEAGQAAVRGLINEMQAGAAITLILAANPPVVLANAESDAQILRQALNTATVSVGRADWATAFAIAAGAAGQSAQNDDIQKTTIVIVSDGGLPEAGLPPLPGEVRFIPIGQTSENLAFTALAIRPLSDSASLQEIFASVTNFGLEDRQVVVSFYAQANLSETPLLFQARQLSIPAQSSAEIELSEIPATMGIVTARLSPVEDGAETVDAFPEDNTAFAVSPQRRSQRIYLLSQDFLQRGVDNQFILRMLFALDYSPFRPALQGEEGARSAQLPTDAFDLYILDGALPVNASGQPTLPGKGSLLLINPPVNPLIASRGTITPTNQTRVATHPLTTYLNWRDVYIAKTQDMTAPSWSVTLVADSAIDIPLVFAGETDGRRIAVLTFDLHDSDLPLNIAYPVLMTNLLNYLLPPQSVETPIEGVMPNEVVAILARPEADQVVVGLPDGSLRAFTPAGQSLSFDETNQLGLYAINTYLPGEQAPESVDVFAVNLFDASESNITPRRVIQVGQTPLSAADASAVGEMELRPWLILAALVILFIEWWVYHRPAWRRGDKPRNWLLNRRGQP
jgi:hypothetical protein